MNGDPGERKHDPLWDIFLNGSIQFTNLNSGLTLPIKVKAMIGTLPPELLVPTLLVLGCLPRFSSVRPDLPEQREGLKTPHESRSEMATVSSELQIKCAFMSRVPRITDLLFEQEDKIRVNDNLIVIISVRSRYFSQIGNKSCTSRDH